MNKKTKGILIAAVIIVVIVALFLPNNNQGYSLETFACGEVIETSENTTTLNKISCSEYIEKIQEKENNLILIARPTCGACSQFTPILEEIAEEYDITINYFDTDTLSETELSSFYQSSDLYKSSSFGTPTMIITNNKTITKFTIGYKSKEDAVKWLKKAGVIK